MAGGITVCLPAALKNIGTRFATPNPININPLSAIIVIFDKTIINIPKIVITTPNIRTLNSPIALKFRLLKGEQQP